MLENCNTFLFGKENCSCRNKMLDISDIGRIFQWSLFSPKSMTFKTWFPLSYGSWQITISWAQRFQDTNVYLDTASKFSSSPNFEKFHYMIKFTHDIFILRIKTDTEFDWTLSLVRALMKPLPLVRALHVPLWTYCVLLRHLSGSQYNNTTRNTIREGENSMIAEVPTFCCCCCCCCGCWGGGSCCQLSWATFLHVLFLLVHYIIEDS